MGMKNKVVEVYLASTIVVNPDSNKLRFSKGGEKWS